MLVSEPDPLGSPSVSKQLSPSELSLLLWERSGEEWFRRWRHGMLNRSADIGDGVEEEEGDVVVGRRQQEQ
jgi:hypothetical protein